MKLHAQRGATQAQHRCTDPASCQENWPSAATAPRGEQPPLCAALRDIAFMLRPLPDRDGGGGLARWATVDGFAARGPACSAMLRISPLVFERAAPSGSFAAPVRPR